MTRRERIAVAIFAKMCRVGSLELTLPSGATVLLGAGSPSADIIIRDREALRRILREGLLGFAEGHMSGDIDTSSLDDLVDWGVANQRAWFEHPLSRVSSPLRKLWQKVRPERRHRLVQTMNQHYNLGNDFYAAWLDPSMTYSSARFRYPEESLESAQENKYQAIAESVGLEPGMAVLEIGCGWGGFATYAATNHQVAVAAVTLSEQQAAGARARVAESDLADRVSVEVVDFRDVAGTYDAVVSIEMIESVDETQWPDLFETIAARLRPGGRAGMQVITIGDVYWERYRSSADFIQQYIFPGGQLPAPKILRKLASDAGLEVVKVDTFGPDYARTLSLWKASFRSGWPRLEVEFGLDERFRRMWELYLTLCEAGFRIGRINVEQWVFAVAPAQN